MRFMNEKIDDPIEISGVEISHNRDNLEVIIKNEYNNTYVVLDGKKGNVLNVLQLLKHRFDDKDYQDFYKDELGNSVETLNLPL